MSSSVKEIVWCNEGRHLKPDMLPMDLLDIPVGMSLLLSQTFTMDPLKERRRRRGKFARAFSHCFL